MQSDFKGLLMEVERLRGALKERELTIEGLKMELKALPSLIEVNSNSMMLKNAQRELEELRR
jgi:hypothetical protein